jgi:hypothetical protein
MHTEIEKRNSFDHSSKLPVAYYLISGLFYVTIAMWFLSGGKLELGFIVNLLGLVSMHIILIFLESGKIVSEKITKSFNALIILPAVIATILYYFV